MRDGFLIGGLIIALVFFLALTGVLVVLFMGGSSEPTAAVVSEPIKTIPTSYNKDPVVDPTYIPPPPGVRSAENMDGRVNPNRKSGVLTVEVGNVHSDFFAVINRDDFTWHSALVTINEYYDCAYKDVWQPGLNVMIVPANCGDFYINSGVVNEIKITADEGKRVLFF